jgi:hypothetical protein
MEWTRRINMSDFGGHSSLSSLFEYLNSPPQPANAAANSQSNPYSNPMSNSQPNQTNKSQPNFLKKELKNKTNPIHPHSIQK